MKTFLIIIIIIFIRRSVSKKMLLHLNTELKKLKIIKNI